MRLKSLLLLSLTSIFLPFIIFYPISSLGMNKCIKEENIKTFEYKMGEPPIPCEPYLYLSYCNLQDGDLPDVIFFLENHSNVKAIVAEGNNITRIGAAILAHAKLTKLVLDATYIGDDGAALLAKSSTLSDLSIRAASIGDKGATALAKNQILEKLDLSCNAIGDEGIAALAKNNSLKKLVIWASYTSIGPNGMKAFDNNTSLTELDVSGNKIGDEGVSTFYKNNTLKTLDISNNNIGSPGAISLAKNTSITKLKLDSTFEGRTNYITDEGAIALANNER